MRGSRCGQQIPFAEAVWCLTQLAVQSPLQTQPHFSTFSGGFLLIGRPPGDSQIMPFCLCTCFSSCLEKILLVLLGDLLLFRDGSNITSSVKKACLPSAHPHAPHVVLGLPSGRSSYMLVYRRDVNRRPPYCIAITALRLSSQPPESGSRLIPLCSTHSVAPGGRRSQMPPKQGNINAT